MRPKTLVLKCHKLTWLIHGRSAAIPDIHLFSPLTCLSRLPSLPNSITDYPYPSIKLRTNFIPYSLITTYHPSLRLHILKHILMSNPSTCNLFSYPSSITFSHPFSLCHCLVRTNLELSTVGVESQEARTAVGCLKGIGQVGSRIEAVVD
jgi:hypothetical protein